MSTNERTIRVFTSRGTNVTLTSDASTWGELKPLVEEHFDLSNLQAAESVNKTTLEHRDARLPNENFVLFLRPVKSKAGNDELEGFFDALFKKIKGEEDAEREPVIEEEVDIEQEVIKALHKYKEECSLSFNTLVRRLQSLFKEGEEAPKLDPETQNIVDDFMDGFED